MSTKKQRDAKLKQSKEILKALGLPKAQHNDRSGWVFLALADIRPESPWGKAASPLLPTVDIMQFIRKHYKQDYKPNSRETIRRQTLHQFEQARIVDRNRDDPSRPTNSKDNNYSLNESILAVLREYPAGEWRRKVEEYKQNSTALKSLYAKKLDKEKIPITLPDGKKISLSPGKHNQLHADIAWETEVWIADNPDHMIHFNGDRFLGPHEH